MNKKEAFKYFGIIQNNERWSWSGISEDGKTVALTIWTDQSKYQNGKWHYSNFNKNNEIWINSPGNKDRIKHIEYCIKNLDSKFRVIWVHPKKKGVFDETRDIKQINPLEKGFFKITRFDEITGEFEAESTSD